MARFLWHRWQISRERSEEAHVVERERERECVCALTGTDWGEEPGMRESALTGTERGEEPGMRERERVTSDKWHSYL